MLVLTRRQGQSILIRPAADLDPATTIADLFANGPIEVAILGIDGKHHEDVHDRQYKERRHCDEVPIARPLVPAEQRREPGELDGLPDREPAQGRRRSEQHDEAVGRLLERVVLALRRMLFPEPVLGPAKK